MATYTVYATVGTADAVAASFPGYYDAVTVYYPVNSTNTTNVPVWVTTNGVAAVADADDSVPVYPGQTVVIPNQEGIWYQGESTVQYGSNNQWGQSLNGGRGTGARSDPGTQVNAICSLASQPVEIIGV